MVDVYPYVTFHQRRTLADQRWSISMKTTILAALAVLSVGAGTAFAQGKPPGTDPGTAPQAFPNEPYHTGTVFSELYHNIFGPSSKTDVANKANSPNATPANGG
jgi:hypothetical protein